MTIRRGPGAKRHTPAEAPPEIWSGAAERRAQALAARAAIEQACQAAEPSLVRPRASTRRGRGKSPRNVALIEADTRTGLPWFATETKRQDARFRWYLERYGARCWELDALSPVTLRNRVEQAIVERLDRAAWERAAVTERAECESLATILNAWPGTARSSISGQASE